MTGILGRKLGMTQIFDEKGRVIPVTVVEAGPCRVVQVKTKEKDGYEAVQVGFDEIKKTKRVNRPMAGHVKKAGVVPCRVLREFPMTELNVGDEITVERFQRGDLIDVTGISKGKGFQGVMKRLGFGGGPGSHGSMFNRAPGSIGMSSYPSRVWKNRGMPGRMGNERTTIKNLTVADVKPDQNVILIRGALPGAKGAYLELRKDD
jgi:large subunit ribosomal protein L3